METHNFSVFLLWSTFPWVVMWFNISLHTTETVHTKMSLNQHLHKLFAYIIIMYLYLYTSHFTMKTEKQYVPPWLIVQFTAQNHFYYS